MMLFAFLENPSGRTEEAEAGTEVGRAAGVSAPVLLAAGRYCGAPPAARWGSLVTSSWMRKALDLVPHVSFLTSSSSLQQVSAGSHLGKRGGPQSIWRESC